LPLIDVRQLEHTYAPPGQPPVTALRGIDLCIESGAYVAIVGANGSGKTTLARHLNALLLPTAGDVYINGRNTRDPEAVRAIRTDIGMVFQSPLDQIVATIVSEDVAFGPENIGVPGKDLPRVVRDALERVGMWEARRRPTHLLSVGQQQRVAIAGVLAMDPRCLVLDEATAMLDPVGRKTVLHILDQLHRDGLTIVTITHSMAEAAHAERVVVLSQGQIAIDGAPRSVFQSEELPELGLAVPPVAEMARRLRQRGIQLPSGLLTVDEFADAVAAWSGARAGH
jgi:energy-coupling factor transporter ATPase